MQCVPLRQFTWLTFYNIVIVGQVEANLGYKVGYGKFNNVQLITVIVFICAGNCRNKESTRGNNKLRQQLYYNAVIESTRGNRDLSGKLYEIVMLAE